ncbi:MAG: 50S ribosomal protein L24, partial [Clostridiales bacterium]|nr:50S ribosomal protein L24 [Clostridiales bacterium]
AGGANKKKTGKVLEVFPADNTVVVEDVNILTRHKKAKSAQDQGGRIKLPGPINASNVVVICPACNQPTRIAYQVTEDAGKKNKVRVCKKCAAVIDAKVESVKAKKERKEKERAARKEKKEKKTKAGKADKAEKAAEAADKADKTEKVEKTVKAEKEVKTETVEKAAKAEKVATVEKAAKTEKAETAEKAAKTETAEKEVKAAEPAERQETV